MDIMALVNAGDKTCKTEKVIYVTAHAMRNIHIVEYDIYQLVTERIYLKSVVLLQLYRR